MLFAKKCAVRVSQMLQGRYQSLIAFRDTNHPAKQAFFLITSLLLPELQHTSAKRPFSGWYFGFFETIHIRLAHLSAPDPVTE
jgi:hypothetical protein